MDDTQLAIRCTHQAQAHILVAVTGVVVVAISRTQVRGIVVPAAATKNAVRA